MKKILHYCTCAVIAVTFTTVVTFSDWVIPTPEAEAAGLGNIAQESTQWLNNALLGTISGSSAANATANIASLAKETVLDGIGWAIAKQIVSSMIRSLINWVNSGFQGSPAFIQDLKQHLLGIVDQAAGQFIQSLGGIGEFICSPFRLDVQAALSINYARARSNMPSGPTEGMCTLSGIGSNIENFLSGTVESMDQWLQVTSNPENTPLGAYLAAEARMNVALRNAAGQEVQLLNFNEGFLSRRICEGVNGQPSQEGQNCRITTPGRVIADQLNRALGAGQDALIEADEINELIGALLSQLTMQALQGINGLLGLGGNSSYTDPTIAGGDSSYLDAMVNEARLMGIDGTTICRLIDQQGTIENDFLQVANFVISTSTVPSEDADNDTIDAVEAEARRYLPILNGNLQMLNEFANRLNAPENYTTATRTEAIVQREVIVQFSQLQQFSSFTTQATASGRRANWTQTFPSLTTFVPSPTLPWGTCQARTLTTQNNSGSF
ncbi:MAG: hypothetical protein ACK42D_01780 [Candidatus Paceibacteria bacterium]